MHDMGQESIDLNPADPYITRITPVSRVDQRVVQKSENIRFYDDALTTSYYGSTSVMSGTISEQRSTTKGSTAVDLSPINRRQTNIRYSPTSYEFTYPKQPDTLMRFVPTGSEIKRSVKSSQSNQTDSRRTLHNQTLASGKDTYTIDRTKRNVELTETRRTNYTRIHIEPTNTMQEWRTPPLWGVRDSAPYLHDGRAATLLEAVSMHEGEAAGTRDRFLNLSHSDRSAIINFMETLVAPGNVPKADL